LFLRDLWPRRTGTLGHGEAMAKLIVDIIFWKGNVLPFAI
jgi:hypothetical protein